ncbi:YfcC family protein [Niallia sp. 03133]|uniref:YfcC family protein n=1 Tax=Niallia sp. 03133 TaxID=3458060 RepID=UPI00404504ED
MEIIEEITNIVKKKWYDRIPSTVVFLFCTLIIGAVLTYLIPAGEFVRVVDKETGVTKIDPNSFHYVDSSPTGILDVFKSIYTGLVEGSGIIFLVFLGYFWVYTMIKTGAFNAVIGKIINNSQLRRLYIPIFIILFVLAGSTYGELTATYGLLPLFIGLAIMMRHDAIIGVCICGMACAIGSAVATSNPYTTALAQNIAQLPMYSGQGLKWLSMLAFLIPTIWYTLRYANKIKKDPSKSIVSDLDFSSYKFDEDKINDLQNSKMTLTQKIVLAIFLLSIVAIVVGSVLFKFGLPEVAMVYTIGALLMSFAARYSADQIAKNFCQACSEIMMVVILIGLARSVLIILTNADVIDTIVYGLYQPIKDLPPWASAQGMLIMQTLLNFVIPSGTGQAVTVMPIMVPLADLSGITRQTAVMAFTYGEGFSNLLYPTAHIGIMLGIAKIPFGRWFKFFMPLFGILLVIQMIFVLIAVLTNYGPF